LPTLALTFISSLQIYINKTNTSPCNVPLFCYQSVNLFSCKASCCYVLDSQCYFRQPTGRVTGTKQEFATNAVLAAGLDYLDLTHIDRQIVSHDTTTMTNNDKGGNSATTTVVQHTVIKFNRKIVEYE